MKLEFRGWRREVKPHKRSVTPVEDGGKEYVPIENSECLTWSNGLKAYGMVENLSLSGAFLVEFNFEEKELENWLLKYAKEHPENALRITSQANAEAMIALLKNS